MGAITIRMSDDMLAYVEEQAGDQGYPDVEAFPHALVIHDRGRKLGELHAALDHGFASGTSGKSVATVFDEASERHRARRP